MEYDPDNIEHIDKCVMTPSRLMSILHSRSSKTIGQNSNLLSRLNAYPAKKREKGRPNQKGESGKSSKKKFYISERAFREQDASMRKAKKASLIMAFLVLVSTSYLSLTFLPTSGIATTHYVGGIGAFNFTTIQEAINNATPGDTIYVFSGTYYENVTVNKTLNITGENRNTTIVDGGGIGDVFNISVDWVNVSRLTVRNSGPDLADAGILLYYIKECNLTEINVWNNKRGINLYGSSNNSISMSDISNNTYGVNFEQSTNNIILNNTVHDNSAGFNFGLDNTNNRIVNNNASSNGFGIFLGYSDNNTISGNTISDSDIGIIIDTANNNSISDNCVLMSIWDAINLRSSYDNRIVNNTLSYGFRGIHFFSSAENNTIRNNTISGNQMVGIQVRTSNNTFVGNVMEANGIHIFGDSLDIWNSHSIDDSNTVNGKPVYYWKNVTSGTIPSNAGQVLLANCSNVVVENQDISNASVAIEVGFSANITLLNNTVSNNPYYGVYLSFSDNGTILDNDVVGNPNYGIYLDSSYDNIVFHNNFIANTIHAHDRSKMNLWNDLYPSGGNYWDDYSGPDQRSGPNQNEPGSDGIGDWPHPTDGSRTWDRYPLMSPFEAQPHPLPPTVLQATLTGIDLENVSINWSLSLDDEMGLRSVIGYEILRNTTYDPEGLGYQLIAFLPNRTSEFVDVSSGEGDPNCYFYRVCARDYNNNTRCAMNQAAKSTRSLSEGPNLVSTPLVMSNESIEAVLQTLNWDKAWIYDSSVQKWMWHMKFKPYLGELESLTHDEGLWVNVTTQSNITVAGIVPEATDIHLSAGWNLVGFPCFNSTYTVGDLKNEINLTRVEGYDSLISPYFLKVLTDGDNLETGFGYWVRVESETTWTVEA